MLIYSYMICLYFHLTLHHVSACLFISVLPPLARRPPPPSFSLHSMRVKATKLCLPLPPLLRLSTPCCPSQPVPRWMTERWRRSWRSASGCRWRCRGYGKKTNRSGWGAPNRSREFGSIFCQAFISLLQHFLYHAQEDTGSWRLSFLNVASSVWNTMIDECFSKITPIIVWNINDSKGRL